jgi:hypothetical protein
LPNPDRVRQSVKPYSMFIALVHHPPYPGIHLDYVQKDANQPDCFRLKPSLKDFVDAVEFQREKDWNAEKGSKNAAKKFADDEKPDGDSMRVNFHWKSQGSHRGYP